MTDALKPTTDTLKVELYAEVTRRATLYTKLFTLQRNAAPSEQIDAILVELSTAEAEIRRISDEVNDRIWYHNYGRMLDLLEKQHEILPQLLNGQKETHGRIAALSGLFQSLAESVSQLEQDLQDQDKRHKKQIGTLSKDVAIVKRIVEARPEQRKIEAAQYEARQRALEDRQSELERQFHEMQGDYTPEQRQYYASILLRIISDYEAEHRTSDGDQSRRD